MFAWFLGLNFERGKLRTLRRKLFSPRFRNFFANFFCRLLVPDLNLSCLLNSLLLLPFSFLLEIAIYICFILYFAQIYVLRQIDKNSYSFFLQLKIQVRIQNFIDQMFHYVVNEWKNSLILVLLVEKYKYKFLDLHLLWGTLCRDRRPPWRPLCTPRRWSATWPALEPSLPAQTQVQGP